nr:unnamed protein product [Digitaria exilis]
MAILTRHEVALSSTLLSVKFSATSAGVMFTSCSSSRTSSKSSCDTTPRYLSAKNLNASKPQ